MRFFLLKGHVTEAVAKAVAALNADSGVMESDRYRNGELFMRVSPSPAGQHCILAGTTAPPDSRMLELLLAAATLKNEGAARVTALIPYLGYARHDKAVVGESMATALLGKFLAVSGIDDIVTFDLHSARDTELIPLPIVSLSAIGLFADVVRREGLADATVIAPDNGAIQRAERLRQEAGISATVVHLRKTRVGGKMSREGPSGAVGNRAIIVDDMLDTGETLVSACEMLKAAGTKEIVVMVTHGIFTGEGWRRLKDLGVRRIYCTDTLPPPANAPAGWISTLSVSDMLIKHFTDQ